MQAQSLPALSLNDQRAKEAGEFLEFLVEARVSLKNNLVSEHDADVQLIREPLEDRYLDDRGQPAMYQRLESAVYDDSRQLVTLWRIFDSMDRQRLIRFQRFLKLEIEGLTGDRHPRKVFDRSPFGVAALIIGTVTIWMTFFRNVSGEDLSELLELVRFNWIAGTVWIGGLFVVMWYILKTLRNNRQVAFLGTLNRALALYLADVPVTQRAA